MKKYTDKDLKQIFEAFGLPTDNDTRSLLKSMEPNRQTNPRVIISAGTSSKFVYRE